MKAFKKWLAIILAIITILTTTTVAMPVFAEGSLFASKDTLVETYKQEEMTSKIVSEVTELREEYAKHFVCEDGSYIAATYSEPVHYKENGQWKEIDNSLELTAETRSGSSKAVYTPTAGIVDVKIPQSFSNGQKVSATNKGYTISFGANQNKTLYKNNPLSTAIVKDVKSLSSSKIKDDAAFTQETLTVTSNNSEITDFNNNVMAVSNHSGAVVYEEVFSNADLEYIVTTNSIKENIVVNEKQSKYIYSFDIDFGELIPIVNEDNSINIVAPDDTEETIFYIEAPYMYDANEVESTAIEMSLVEKDGMYTMTLQADSDWINASTRKFPVVIDPTIYYFSYDDVFVMDGLLNKSTTKINNELRVGRNLTNLTRTYIKPTIPSNIPAGSYILLADLVLTRKSYFQALSGDDIYIYAYDCGDVSNWSAANVTWENQPYSNSDNGHKNGHTRMSVTSANLDKLTYPFDITSAARRWLNGGNNNGIMLASSNESTKTQVDFYSSRVSDSSLHPSMFFYYMTPLLSFSTWETDCHATQKNFTIATGADWTAHSDSDWISLGATSGSPVNGNSTNSLIVSENLSTESRTGTVTIKVGNTVIGTITVSQLGIAPNVILNKISIYAKSAECGDSIEITANTSWDAYATEDWVSLQTVQTSSGNYKLNVTISENPEPTTRDCEIIITGNNIENQSIKVTQLDKVSGYFYDINSDKASILPKSSSEYYHALATWSMYLSNAAYNPLPDDMLLNVPAQFMTDFTHIQQVLNDTAFNDIEQYHYTSSQINTAGHTIAHKSIVNPDGSYKTLIVVAIRGTTAAIEWLTDLKSLEQNQLSGFLGAKNDVLNNLNSYLQTYSSSLNDEKIILVTGHSLGAAVANLVADALNNSEGWNADQVYAYTFATPNIGNHIHTEHTNIFNILNRNDIITLVPFSLVPSALAGDRLWKRHGIDIPITMTTTDNPIDNHKMDTYYNFMLEKDPELNYIGIKAVSDDNVRMGILPKLLSMKCPVGVTVYNSAGEIMAYESQQTTTFNTQSINYTNSDVVSWISDEGEKVFFIPFGSDASLAQIEAYDYGTMTFSIALVDTLTSQPTEVKTFENVSLYPEKEFSVGLSNYVSIADTKLLIVENGTIVGEVTELSPLLKNVTIDNTMISYGTPSTITITTSNMVTGIKLINSIDNSVITYASTDTGIDIIEDGDNLIWTIQTVFATGNWIYDVAVMTNNSWHTTNNVFAVTVN